MDKIWMKEKIHKCFPLIQTRPFILLILLIVVSSTILRIITPCFLVLCSVATLTCIVIGTGDFFAFALRTGEFPSGFNRTKESSSSSHMDARQDFDADGPSWRHKFLQGLRGVSRSSLDFVKRHVLPDIDEEGLMAESVDSTKPNNRVCVDKTRSTNQKVEAKCEFAEGVCVYSNHSENDKPVVCIHGFGMEFADSNTHACAHDEGDLGDVPELEDCSTSGEEEEVCKSVVETAADTSRSHDDIVVVDAMLQLTNAIKAVSPCADEDEHLIDKHQILPLESCKLCKHVHRKGFDAIDLSSKCVRDTNVGIRKLEITDAELQNAASEFYTLEGDVLWSESDHKKQPDGKRLDNGGSDVLSTTCELCKHGKLPVSSENFSIFPSKAWTGAKTFARMPAANSKVVYYVDAKKAQEESGSEDSVCASAEDMNEDVMIDKELRAIASRSGNRGEESNYMSTAGSFRDFVGSFREIDACWPEYGMMGRREDDFIAGCCDDHARPCISHSRSRSKVLQSDPLLSKASLIREQEIMDVLWQEYDDDRRQRCNLGKQQRDFAQKQRLKTGANCSGVSSDSINEVLEEGSSSESINVQANKYVMKLNHAPEYGDYDRNIANNCKLGCDQPCWHMAKTRGYHRRRHFVGFCRVLRELGLKQCMQSSKVDN